MAPLDDMTLTGTHECRPAQLLRAARFEAQLAQIVAAPRMHNALTELDGILEEQIAALADATKDDVVDSAMAATWAEDD